MKTIKSTLLGEERWPIFNKAMSHTIRMEEFTGTMRPDLAYTPKQN